MNAPFLRPHGCPAGVDPARWRKAVTSRIEQLHDGIQALMVALDAMDGDSDLEPSIVGGVEWRNGQALDVLDDREGGDVLDEGEPNDWDGEESDPGEDNGDKEPSMGWPNPFGETPAYHRWGGLRALNAGDIED